MNKVTKDMVYFLSCALNNQKVEPDRVKYADLEQLYLVAERHSVLSMVAMVMETAGVPLPKEWKQEKEKAVRKSILFDVEYQKLTSYMESHGIWYMPLKGRVLQELYPKKGMRQMADMDILFDASRAKELQLLMHDMGYTEKSLEAGVHDSYLKAPFYNVELHRSLFELSPISDVFEDYYQNVKERLLPVKQDGMEVKFSLEDCYIYIMCHAYKHYAGSGTGLRTMADCYLYNKTYGKAMDREYIDKELEVLRISEFEQSTRELCNLIFSGTKESSLSDEEQKLLNYYFTSGTYGFVARRVENRINGYTKKSRLFGKIRYIWRRLFPGKETLEVYCPLAKKHKIFLLYGWIKRVFICVCRIKDKDLQEEINQVVKH